MPSGLTDQFETWSASNEVEPDLKIVLSRLATEIKRRLDGGSAASKDFISSALRTLSKVRGTQHADVRMSCLYDCGAFFLSSQMEREALECGKLLEALAKRVGDLPWVRKAVMFQGIVYAHMGDFGEAVLHFSCALTLTRELEQPYGESSVLNNLATALNYAGLYKEAIPCLHRSISIATRHADLRPYAASAYCNLAQSYLGLGEYQRGMDAITCSLAASDEPADAFGSQSRVVREFTFVQLALELGRLNLAREHVRACGHYARLNGHKKAAFLSVIANGLCEIHGGDVNKGLLILESALETSSEKGTSEYLDALTALVKAYDITFQHEKALQKLSTLLADLRARREQSLAALVSVGEESQSPISIASEDVDLQALTVREAQLRAQVAEREVVRSHIEVLERLAVTADLREEESGEHGYRVGSLAALCAEQLGWSAGQCAAVDLAARLHDIGKIAMPDRILLNTEKLREAERHFMSTHTTIGAELLGKSNVPQLRMAEEIARYHHEWWNGEGYPAKLKGKRIPIHARIVALADVFDALTHGRPFSPPWPIDRAVAEIGAKRGTQFDPELTDLFLGLVDRLRKEHQDLDEYLGRASKSSPFLQARNRIRKMLADEREHEKKATVSGNETRH